MIIGFDIDDVLANFMSSLLKFSSPILKRNFSVDEMKYVEHYGEIWNVDLEKAKEIVKDFYQSDEFKLMESNPEAKNLLKYISGSDMNVLAITSRPDFLKQSTLIWLEENFGKIFNEYNVYFTNIFWGQGKSKGEISKELGIDYFVEDGVSHAKSLIENNIKVFLYDKPWNQSFKVRSKLLKRVKNLEEIRDLILVL